MNVGRRSFLVGLLVSSAWAQQSQNPSPMVEHSRVHRRLAEAHPPGMRAKLEIGDLFVPAELRGKRRVPLFIHFHGAGWIAEAAATRSRMATITVQLGSGSGVYARPFADAPGLFGALLDEAERKAGATLRPVTLTAWSAGYGAIREILRQESHYARIERVLLLDGLHTGYIGGKPGPLESQIETAGLEPFVRFAADAVGGTKRMTILHSEIFPGTFASTTETAEYILSRVGIRRRAVLKWGPMGMQQLSEARKGGLRVVGYAGNTAPDHVDQLHSLPELLTKG